MDSDEECLQHPQPAEREYSPVTVGGESAATCGQTNSAPDVGGESKVEGTPVENIQHEKRSCNGDDLKESEQKDQYGCQVSQQSEKEEMVQLKSTSSSEILSEEDNVDFPWFSKKLSLLEYCKDKELSESSLLRILSEKKAKEEVDLVDKDYGPIHYLVTGRHRNKPSLLEQLVVVGGADVDLTTTGHEYTALHLAVKHSQYESVEALVALNADVNLEDSVGNTPLDLVNLQHTLKKSGSGEFTLYPLNRHKKFLESVSSPDFNPPMEEDDSSSLDRIKSLLQSVGASLGSSSNTHQRRSMSHRRGGERHMPGSSHMPDSSHMQHVMKTETEVSNFKKINTVYYKEVHEKFREWICHSPMPHPMKAGEAENLLRMMAEAEEYRKKCGSRILVLDGGGMRGLIQLTVLEEIERLMGKRIVELFDWIIGTSTGGIIALALTYGPTDEHSGIRQTKTVRQLRDLYWSLKDEIFGSLLGFLAKGNTRKLEQVLQQWLGKDTALKDVTYPKVLIPAVSKKHSDLEMHFFNNCFNDELSTELVWKVARYTSAAPFYFKEFEGYIDGGMMANNPSGVGLTEIQKFYHNRGEKLPISLVVSIGSGLNPSSSLGEIDIKSNPLDPKRYTDLLQVITAAVVNRPAHDSCKVRCQEEGISYYRFNPDLLEKVESEQNDSSVLQRMILTTRKYLHRAKDDLEDLTKKLRESNLTSTLTVT